MRYRAFVCLTFALLVSACGNLKVAQLGTPPTVDDTTLKVVDLRTEEQKQARRDSNYSAIAYLGDTEVNPPALLFLKSAVQRQAGSAAKLTLEISELRVIDFFPVRLRAGGQGQGWLGKAIWDGLADAKTDFAFIEHLGAPESENSVICVVAGKLNGKLVKTATFRTYKESAMAVSIRNDPSFKSALIGAVDAAAEDLVSQFRAAP